MTLAEAVIVSNASGNYKAHFMKTEAWILDDADFSKLEGLLHRARLAQKKRSRS